MLVSLLQVGRNSDLKIFSKRFKQAREAAFLSQEEFAEAADMATSNVQRMERGDITGIMRNKVPRIAKALRLTEAEFMDKIAVPDHVRDAVGRIIAEPPPRDDRPIIMSAEKVEGRTPADYLVEMVRNLSDAERDRLRRLLDSESQASGDGATPGGAKKPAPRDDIEPITPPPKPVKGRPRRAHHPKDKERN